MDCHPATRVFMNKAIASAIALSALLGTVLAQDVANKDQAVPPKAPATEQATTKTFSDFQIGMQFDYASNWVMVADPKPGKGNWLDTIIGKKKKPKIAAGKQAQGESLFYVPANGRTANLEIYGVMWAQTPDLWETNQVDANNALKRQVVKQWREEILGVPLLLTKIAYEDAATGPTNAIIGLVYSRTPYKMLFRLTCIDTDYDAADFELRQALQSLRTTSGAMPLPEDPNHPLDASAYVKVVNKAPKVWSMTTAQPDPAKVKKGEVLVNAIIANTKSILSMPAGWTADAPAADGTITLHNAAVTGAVVISLASVLDSDPPQAAILKASAASLDAFTKVDKRHETQHGFTTAGAATDTIWREGAGANGALTTCEAYGATGEQYWLLRYQMAGTPTAVEMKAINDLIDGMSVDPAP